MGSSAGWPTCWPWPTRSDLPGVCFNAPMLRPGRLLLAIPLFLLFAAPAQAAFTGVSAKPNPVTYPSLTTIKGKATPGQPVQLEEKPAGASGFSPTEPPVVADSDGSFTFKDLGPGFNTTYRLSTAVDKAITLRVIVNERLTSKVTPLGLGRMRLKVTSQHPKNLKWGGRHAYVFLSQGSSRFKLVARVKTSQKG